MKRTKNTRLLIILISLAVTGCTTKTHYTSAVLKRLNSDGRTYSTESENGIPFSSNFVRVNQDARIVIQLDSINPGWIHEGSSYSLKRRQLDGSVPISGENIEMTPQLAQHLSDRSLWVVCEVKSKSPTDPLELQSKKVIKSSVIKYGTRSFGLIPLDQTEASSIALESTTIYDVKITVYEVKDILTKRLLLQVKNSGGIKGLWDTAETTVKTLWGGIVGDIETVARKEFGEDLLPERIALSIGATKEFEGHFSILRSSKKATGLTSNRYILADMFKTYDPGTPDEISYSDPVSYNQTLKKFINPDKYLPSQLQSFVTFSILEAKKPRATTGISILKPEATEKGASLSLQIKTQSIIISGLEKSAETLGTALNAETSPDSIEKILKLIESNKDAQNKARAELLYLQNELYKLTPENQDGMLERINDTGLF